VNAAAHEPRLALSLPARAENVPLVRHALAGLAETLEMDPAEVADLKTVVTEACMNAVIHAYGPSEGDEGPLDVHAWPEEKSFVIRVRDYGQGIRPLADVERRSLRLGIPLIAALSERFAVSGVPGQGTEVTMWMPLGTNGSGSTPKPPQLRGETRVRVSAGDVLEPVLSRLMSMLAARADFSVDRLSDTVLLSDAIAAGGQGGFESGTARISVREHNGSFTLRIGALEEGGGERLIEAMRIPAFDASLEELADEVKVEREGDAEYLVVTISQTSTD
jgi:serine/threonine-protein kinase RsbW